MSTYLDGRAVELNQQQLKNHAIKDYIIVYNRVKRNIYLADTEGNLSYLGISKADLTLNEALQDPYMLIWVYSYEDEFKKKLIEVLKSSF